MTGNKKATIVVASFLVAIGGVVLSAAPAFASSAAIHGTQWDDTTIYWSKGRSNTYAYNGMSISPYSSVDCGYYTLQAGARYTSSPGASSGKTGVMSPGQTSAFYNANLGNYRMPMGTFYLTTTTGLSGGCTSYEPTWYATLIYNVAN